LHRPIALRAFSRFALVKFVKCDKISELTTNRLSVYLRCLNEIAATGAKTVSSRALADKFHLNSAQIRKDLAYFGEFGVRGVGYTVDGLRSNLIRILGLDKEHRVGIIGAGRLGTALTDYYGFRKANFTVVALFDSDAKRIGKKVGDAEVKDVKNFAATVKRDKIELAVIAVPAEAAKDALDMVLKAGIRAVMNFAPVALKSPPDVKLKTIDLTTSLESLSYFLACPVKPAGKKRRKQ
jgi:redox-sensing transcriptional repressor